MRPPLRWLGSKRRLASKILTHVPDEAFLVEPFAGASALTFHRLGGGWINDVNDHLISFYRALVQDPDAVWADTQAAYVAYSGSQDGYIRARAEYNDRPTPGLFYFLNKHSYSGLWRVNKSGGMNAPYGGSPKKGPEQTAFKSAGEHLAGIWITSGTYLDCRPSEGDYVYLDPPYPGTFAGYDATPVDHDALLDWANDVAESGAKVLVSGMMDAQSLERWDGWEVLDLGTVAHTVRKGGHVRAREVLFTK